MGVSGTPAGANRRLVAYATVALVALAPAAPCGAEIFTLVRPDGSLLITDEPLLPPAKAVVLAITPGEHPIDSIARRHGVDPLLVRAVIRVESNFDPRAVSPKGAAGLMQLMPETAQRYGVDNRFDPAQNVDGGVRYLRDLMAMFPETSALRSRPTTPAKARFSSTAAASRPIPNRSSTSCACGRSTTSYGAPIRRRGRNSLRQPLHSPPA